MRFKAVVFDLDGTLTDTLKDIAFAMNRALRMNGLPEHPLKAYCYLVGNGAKVLAIRAVGERRELAEKVQADYQAYYQDHTRDTTKPYEGIPELLRALNGLGLKLCVLSNKPHRDTVGVVKHFFPEIPFACVRGQVEGVPVKPDPAGALLVAQEIGVRPEEILYLGDTGVDMETAVSAGMYPVGVTWGFRTAEELLQSGAKMLLDHPMKLMKNVTSL